MKWSAPSERVQFAILSPVIIPAAAILAIGLAPMIALLMLGDWKRKRFGPTSTWLDWFAWHPVKINDWFDRAEGRWVWLEKVARRGGRGWTEYKSVQAIEARSDKTAGLGPQGESAVAKGDAPKGEV